MSNMGDRLPTSPACDISQGAVLLGLIWTANCMAVVFVALRLYSRATPSNVLGWDDFTILLGLVCSTLGLCSRYQCLK